MSNPQLPKIVMPNTPLHYQSLADLARQLQARTLSPVALTEHFLARIEALNGTLGAFRLTTRARALAEAEAAEAALRSGRTLGPLHGIPYALKDLFDVRGAPTTAGSNLLADNIAAEDAFVVARLAQAGMILLGKTVTVQFAFGGVGINHHHGTPHNPWHRAPHVSGGSSSGSAVAVAAGLAPLALGTDTGGSVRIPAALCGVTGLKTTVGQVSRAGVFPLSASLDSVGPLARTAEDAALVYQAIRGRDPHDPSTTTNKPTGEPANEQDVLAGLRDGVRGLRLAFPESAFWDDADPEVVAAVRACGPVFADLGAHVGSIAFPAAAETERLNPRGIIGSAEAYAVHRERIERHFDGYDPIVGTRIMAAKQITAADYITTQWALLDLRARAVQAMRDVDALLVPTTMIPAAPVAEADASLEVYAQYNSRYLRNTSIGNGLGLCGLSVPCGFTRAGLPIGLMIYGKPFQEEVVLRVGYAYQQATDWHRRTPNL
jgi:aspartyl-tRNA(Asn)/glutamyl-tRNA(Gln) amidotransferase subunit A